MMKMEMIIIITTSTFVSTLFTSRGYITDVGKIFSTVGQHHIFFEIRFQRKLKIKHLLCTRRNGNF